MKKKSHNRCSKIQDNRYLWVDLQQVKFLTLSEMITEEEEIEIYGEEPWEFFIFPDDIPQTESEEKQ